MLSPALPKSLLPTQKRTQSQNESKRFKIGHVLILSFSVSQSRFQNRHKQTHRAGKCHPSLLRINSLISACKKQQQETIKRYHKRPKLHALKSTMCCWVMATTCDRPSVWWSTTIETRQASRSCMPRENCQCTRRIKMEIQQWNCETTWPNLTT